MSRLTEELARFAAHPGFGALPQRAIDIVQSGFIDTIATMIAGRDEPVVGIVRRFVAERQSSAREASLLFGATMAASSDAALINATAGHALDFDDVALGGHPSTVLVPAVMAEGERLGASGAEALRAYLVGYEVWAELAAREPDAYHLKGWHPTPVLGTVAAAAALAHLRKMPPAQAQHAIALAASMASGLVANFGTMTKPLHAGRAAACAIDAVRLAASGLTAAPDALEHHAGYLAALSPKGRADRDSPPSALGTRLRILDSGLSIKKYPVCYATHRVIDGVLDLANAHAIRPEDVIAVRASIGVAQASMLRNHSPLTGLEAKFSLEFTVASALVARRVGLRELTDAFVTQPSIRALMPKVTIGTVDTQCPIEAIFAMHDRVQIDLADGRRLDSGEIRFARGNAMLPLQAAELHAKFMDCVAGASELDGEGLFDRLSHLADQPSLRGLGQARQPAAMVRPAGLEPA
ncbi:MAG: MmgE/PrpD family protein [Burkholderiaceae bacterium]|nr:MmgE/PrpD family protein [Burkholderiaceae bacterium]